MNQLAARRLAHVVGIGLECQAPQRKMFACEVCAELLLDFAREYMFLHIVGGFHCVEHLQIMAIFLANLDQRFDIFRKTRASVTAARIEKVITDARVGAYALPHGLNISTCLLYTSD